MTTANVFWMDEIFEEWVLVFGGSLASEFFDVFDGFETERGKVFICL